MSTGIGSPNHLILEQWAREVRHVFDGEMPYLVGSAVVGREYRDVDVRIVLDDAEWQRRFGPCNPDMDRICMRHNRKWAALMIAISLWGQRVTGLPIDFQVQYRSGVSKADWEKPREPLCNALDWKELEGEVDCA